MKKKICYSVYLFVIVLFISCNSHREVVGRYVFTMSDNSGEGVVNLLLDSTFSFEMWSYDGYRSKSSGSYKVIDTSIILNSFQQPEKESIRIEQSYEPTLQGKIKFQVVDQNRDPVDMWIFVVNKDKSDNLWILNGEAFILREDYPESDVTSDNKMFLNDTIMVNSIYLRNAVNVYYKNILPSNCNLFKIQVYNSITDEYSSNYRFFDEESWRISKKSIYDTKYDCIYKKQK